jgi:hypothetical protein
LWAPLPQELHHHPEQVSGDQDGGIEHPAVKQSPPQAQDLAGQVVTGVDTANAGQ